MKAGGRVLIDGGFSAAYQKTTGLAGFTLVSNAEGLFLEPTSPLISRDAAVEGTADIHAGAPRACRHDMPRTVADTDEGARLREASRFAHLALAARTPASMRPLLRAIEARHCSAPGPRRRLLRAKSRHRREAPFVRMRNAPR